MNEKRLTRRSLLSSQVLGGAALSAGLSAPALAQDSRELRIDLQAGFGDIATRLSNRVSILSDGQLRLTFVDSDPGEINLAAVADGAVDGYLGSEARWVGLDPAFGLFSALPFGMAAKEFEAWYHFGGGAAEWDALSGTYGVKCLLVGDFQSRALGWFKSEPSTLSDFNGLRMAVDGLGAAVIEALGASPQPVPEDVLSAELDAIQSNGFAADQSGAVNSIYPVVAVPAALQPHAAISLGINAGLWQILSEDDRAILDASCAAEADVVNAQSLQTEAEAFVALVDDGVQVSALSQELFTDLTRRADEALGDLLSTSPAAPKAHTAYRRFMEDAAGWTSVSDSAYAVARANALGMSQ